MLVNICLPSDVAIESNRDCSQFTEDYEIIFSLPFVVPFNPLNVNSNRTYAFMDNDNKVTKLFLYKESYVPRNIFCLKSLIQLTISETEFINGEYVQCTAA